MLIVAGTMTLAPAGFDRLRSILPAHKARTEAEEGSVLFSLGIADEAAGEVTVLEIWRDQAALTLHHAQPGTGAFVDTLGETLLALDLKIYTADEGAPLPPLPTLAHIDY